MLITFSGLDGAGKSTLIRALKETLDRQDRKTVVLTMYDHVGLYPLIRFLMDWPKSLLRRGRGQAFKPSVFTNDPDQLGVAQAHRGPLMKIVYAVVRSAFMKRFVLLVDVSAFFFYRFYFEKFSGRTMIMDRYFFDSLADVADGRHWRYTQSILRVLPAPDLSIFVDVAPEVAYARKGEYSLDYLNVRREKYRHIFDRIAGSVSIHNDDFDQTREKLMIAVRQRMSGRWR